jgi:hypothetical protein
MNLTVLVLAAPGNGERRPTPACRERRLQGNQNSLCTSHPLSHASDVLNSSGPCQKDRDSRRNQKDTGDDARPSIFRECVRTSQTDNSNKER